MTSFAPGDYVEATISFCNPLGAIHGGKLYRVAAVMMSANECLNHHYLFGRGSQCPHPGIALYGEPSNVWCVSAFRLVHRPRADLVARILGPVRTDGPNDSPLHGVAR